MRDETKELDLRSEESPGLVDLLERYDLTPSELAARAGVSTRVVNGVLDGTADLTEDLARRFASVLRLAEPDGDGPSYRVGIDEVVPR